MNPAGRPSHSPIDGSAQRGSAPLATENRLSCRRHFKKHLLELERNRTSTGRDVENGWCLDRNERAAPFDKSFLKALKARLSSATLSCYPDPAAFYDKLARFLNVPVDHVYLVGGITEGIRVLYETLTSPGDEVATLEPTYPMYSVYAKIYQTRRVPLGFNADLSLKREDLKAKIGKPTVFAAVANPNLPIECLLDIREIRELAEHCRDQGTFLVVDEAYGYFGAPSALELVPKFDNLIVMQTFSKAFGMAGVRIGALVSQPQNIAYLAKTRSLVEANGLSLAAASYALERPGVMRDYVKAVQKGRDWLRRELERLGARWFGGDHSNAMLIFLRDNATVGELVAHLRNKKIYVRASFEAPLDRCIRLTLGPEKAMRAFLSELKAWTARHPGRLNYSAHDKNL